MGYKSKGYWPDEALQPDIPRGCFSIPEFCVAHRISDAMYFKLKQQGLGPTEMVVGGRRLISVEAAARWRKARETRGAATEAAT
jgi:hypothetical protein